MTIPHVLRGTQIESTEQNALIDQVNQNTLAIQAGGGGDGVTDHGLLQGLADDDHLQYHTDARADARYSPLGHNHDTTYAPIVHSHVVGDTTGLQTALDGKSPTTHNHDAAYAPLSHNHDTRYYTETEVDTALAGKAASVHSHTINDVTSLQTSLDGKSPSTHNHDAAYSAVGHTHNYDPAGTAASEVAAHEADPAPHYRPTAATLNGTAATVDASQFNAVNITLNGAGTLNVPTGGADGSVVQVVAYAAAEQTLTLDASFERLTGIDASYVIPAGKRLRALLRRSTVGADGWIVEAVGVTQ